MHLKDTRRSGFLGTCLSNGWDYSAFKDSHYDRGYWVHVSTTAGLMHSETPYDMRTHSNNSKMHAKFLDPLRQGILGAYHSYIAGKNKMHTKTQY